MELDNIQDNFEIVQEEPVKEPERQEPADGLQSLLNSSESDDEEEDDEPEEEPAEATVQPFKATAQKNPIKFSLVRKGLVFADKLNANICRSISGDKDNSEYQNTDEARDEFADELTEYLELSGLEMSPGLAITISAIFFFGSPIFVAYQVKADKAAKAKAEADRQRKEDEQAAREAQAASDTSDNRPKEARERRRSFDTHATTGCYKFPANSASGRDAIKVGEAVEKPSEIVQTLINSGKTNDEIRAALGYE